MDISSKRNFAKIKVKRATNNYMVNNIKNIKTASKSNIDDFLKFGYDSYAKIFINKKSNNLEDTPKKTISKSSSKNLYSNKHINNFLNKFINKDTIKPENIYKTKLYKISSPASTNYISNSGNSTITKKDTFVVDNYETSVNLMDKFNNEIYDTKNNIENIDNDSFNKFNNMNILEFTSFINPTGPEDFHYKFNILLRQKNNFFKINLEEEFDNYNENVPII